MPKAGGTTQEERELMGGGGVVSGSGSAKKTTGIKRTNSDMQQSTLSFANTRTSSLTNTKSKSKSTTTPKPILSKSSSSTSLINDKAILNPDPNQSDPFLSTPTTSFPPHPSLLGESKESTQMIQNLEGYVPTSGVTSFALGYERVDPSEVYSKPKSQYNSGGGGGGKNLDGSGIRGGKDYWITTDLEETNQLENSDPNQVQTSPIKSQALSTSTNSSEEDERLITPKKARIVPSYLKQFSENGKKGLGSGSGSISSKATKVISIDSDGEEEEEGVVVEEDEDDDVEVEEDEAEGVEDEDLDEEDENERTLKELLRPSTIVSQQTQSTLDGSFPSLKSQKSKSKSGATTIGQGEKVRSIMLGALEEVKTASTSGSGGIGNTGKSTTTKGKGKSKEVVTIDEGDHLNPKDKKWEKIYWEASKEMGGDDCPPIHCTPKSHTRIHHILRVFDLTSAYGPCIGISRLQRWERAKAWGLEPPEAIKEILLTIEGSQESDYRETVFFERGIYSATS